MTTLADRPNTALLAIDVQNSVVADACRRDAVIGNIAQLVGRARAASRPGDRAHESVLDLPDRTRPHRRNRPHRRGRLRDGVSGYGGGRRFMISCEVSMPIVGEYVPSAAGWVRDQVAENESSGGTRANTLRDTGLPVVIVTYRGKQSGKVRKIALMRVEHDGHYALVASKGGAPQHPEWYFSVAADPRVMIQDGPEPRDYVVREVEGAERAAWWERCVAAYPPYAEYQTRTDRLIPVFVAEPA